MTNSVSYPGRATPAGAGAITSLLVALALGGCASSADFPTGAIAITLKPGDTGTCVTALRGQLVMPPARAATKSPVIRSGLAPTGRSNRQSGRLL
ncbi:MAG: hypothetical protein IPN92_20815 [Chromatiaceae bacterium]|nr:hypothetical protein [Chromatiaceae bacterium]